MQRHSDRKREILEDTTRFTSLFFFRSLPPRRGSSTVFVEVQGSPDPAAEKSSKASGPTLNGVGLFVTSGQQARGKIDHSPSGTVNTWTRNALIDLPASPEFLSSELLVCVREASAYPGSSFPSSSRGWIIQLVENVWITALEYMVVRLARTSTMTHYHQRGEQTKIIEV